ncbi:MAG: hypothetical protein CFH06_01436 [Alphaproteobacteria bacterium MarineAlpha3_Bin5]|nr:MAG: hypothetical protein CFH06_01436 [Alphaproteobacteria bacterium MarineAlpha3_Bin5]
MPPESNAQIKIRYILEFDDSEKEIFDITLDKLTGKLVTESLEKAPDWARLEFEQCSNCPLESEDVDYCPAAISLKEIAKRVGSVLSHSKVNLVVIFDERWVGKRTTSQEVISSLMGLHIATSGCPRTDYLRPMARFHLPLASSDETLVRTIGSYYLSQYFKFRLSQSFDIELSGLADLYAEMQKVNSSIAKRLRASGEFTEINSLTILDTFAQGIPLQIEDNLDDIESLFET